MKLGRLSFLFAMGFAIAGCSVGDAPKGLSAEETRAAVDALPPDKQIDYINRSPIPQAEKEKRIADIKAKAGMK